MNRTALRLLNLPLCALLPGPMSLPVWAIARPENRVEKIFPAPLKSASDFASQPVDTRRENPGCGYDFASGVHRYLSAADHPGNNIDPSGQFSEGIGGLLAVLDSQAKFQGPPGHRCTLGIAALNPAGCGHEYSTVGVTEGPSSPGFTGSVIPSLHLCAAAPAGLARGGEG